MDFPVAEMSVPAHLEAPAPLVELKGLRGGSVDDAEEEGAGGLRYKAIRQEGLRVGAQTGLAHRYSMVMSYLKAVEPKLNVVFSFNGFVKDGRLLVPAVVEIPNQFVRDETSGEVRVIRNAFTIEEEAKIVSVVPTWRDYLWQEYSYPEKPHRSLLPRTDAEAKAWEEAVNEGWRAGVSQADTIYQDRLAMLTKAVEGRNLYRTLESKKMVSPAALKIVSNRVTFNGRTMNVGEVIYNIGSAANYTASDTWRPVWTR
ncbi:type IV secretory system conjugative DNA transfer family protein (plasmid) [Stutzerimonas frequens]|uniref:type IV secretory system conjugative DNA transfer family protein n=1 Tax=Stutzerimonas frequens TaxID=2968969 RepID=UPI002DBDD09B|nr:type IV secretory system conjugative DNA transfer family protein [Stutzerimonas frequens]WRW29293.1 type IV secretory system conjugative DNA transfer family protein [Stutzerimonas frequens]